MMNRLLWAFKYGRLTLRHKWYVFLAGVRDDPAWVARRPRLLWRLLVHDCDKFRPAQLLAYGRQFFAPPEQRDAAEFAAVWLRHQNRCDHHWEYWIPRSGGPGGPLPMPVNAMLEMLADWMGASRAYSGAWPSHGQWPWLAQHYREIVLHPSTRAAVAFRILCLMKIGGVR